MRFDIKGYREPDGVLVASFEAASVEEARLLAGEQGIRVLSVSKNWRDSFALFQRKRFDLQLLSQELHALLDAGLSLIEALTALAGKESAPEKRALLDHIMQRLREGRPLSSVLQERPDIFPPLFVSLVGASERTGDLKSALSRYIAYRGQMDAVKKKVVSASIYPALLIFVGGLVVLFLMGYVVPRFSRIYGDFGRDIPLMSRLLIHWGSLVEAYGLQVVAACVAVIGGLWVLGRRHFDRQRLLEGLLASRADFGAGKSARSLPAGHRTLRHVDLNTRTKAALMSQKHLTFLAGGHVFLNPVTGAPWADDYRQRINYWHPTLKALGLRARDAYQTRHTYATLLLMSGANPAYVAQQLGHTTMKITLERYARWVPRADNGAEIAKFEARLSSENVPKVSRKNKAG